jgi:hypothetical protein
VPQNLIDHSFDLEALDRLLGFNNADNPHRPLALGINYEVGIMNYEGKKTVKYEPGFASGSSPWSQPDLPFLS